MTREGYKKHYELIEKWKDGAEIQRWDSDSSKWVDSFTTVWSENSKYRLKPLPTTLLPNIDEVIKWFVIGKVFKYKAHNALGKLESVVIDKEIIFIHSTQYDIPTFCKNYTHEDGSPLIIRIS